MLGLVCVLCLCVLYPRAYLSRLRTKAARTIGAYEPSEPWYGRFFADFLLVLLIVLTFQVGESGRRALWMPPSMPEA